MRNNVIPDAELVRRSVAGNREAFGSLYDRHYRLVRVVAAGAGPARSEDVIQETFLRAYRNLHSLRNPSGFSYWLVGIARKVLQEVRRWPLQQSLPDGLLDDSPDPGACIDQADELGHLRTLVNRLPEEQRHAVQFFFLKERNADEVAELLGRSRSGTYALLSQAIATLGHWMKQSLTDREVKP